MNEKELYTIALGVENPWRVAKVEAQLELREFTVFLRIRSNAKLVCPVCQRRASGYDKKHRRWRHLNKGSVPTFVEADIPRINCSEHGTRMISVPWSEAMSRYTAEFEADVITRLLDASISAVALQMGVSWNAIAGIQERAIVRGLARRDSAAKLVNIGIDETSFKKGHNYITVVHDGDTGGVLHVSEDRTKDSGNEYYDALSESQKEGIRSVSMDMWPAYINTTLAAIPDAESKIAFDKFHVAGYLFKACDGVRKQEHQELMSQGNDILKGTKYRWLSNPQNEDQQRCKDQKALRGSNLKTARACAIKEHAMCL